MNTEQSRALPPVQTPDWHVSPTLQKSPSLHAEPFGSGAVQESVVSLQLSAQLPSPSAPGHGLPALTLQTPEALHLSVPSQKSPSLHGVLAGRVVHVPGDVPLHV